MVFWVPLDVSLNGGIVWWWGLVKVVWSGNSLSANNSILARGGGLCNTLWSKRHIILVRVVWVWDIIVMQGVILIRRS